MIEVSPCDTFRFSSVAVICDLLFLHAWKSVTRLQSDWCIFHGKIYGQSPEYLKELINTRSNTQYNLRSNNGLFLTFPTIKTRKTLGDRAFCVAAPTVWNNLPKSIRKEQDFKKFKSLLKTFLFKTAYN